MRTVRARIAATAAITTAIAVSLASVLLLTQMSTSLDREIDQSLERQIFNFELEIAEYSDFETVAVPNDPETLLIVVDPSGFAPLANDIGVDGSEVANALGLASASAIDVLFADISLTTPTETTEPDRLRAAYYEVLLDDQKPGERFFAVVARSAGPTDRTIGRLRTALLVGVPLVVAFVAALAWWLAGRALRPVDQMRREVDEITSSDLDRRVTDPNSPDEVGHLAATMNRMLTRLQEAQARQDRFVSDAAHELRTPLASMAAQLDVDATHPTTADSAQTATNLRGEVARLQALIDGLLASARNRDAASSAPAILIDLDVVVGDAVARVPRPEHIHIDQRSVSAATVRGNPASIASLVDNLLANAYRHASSRVAIGVGGSDTEAWLTVDDDGSGVDPADWERIFDRFVRLDEARSRDTGGSGLGLALARDVAHHHDGTLHVTASDLGGARFSLRLPPA